MKFSVKRDTHDRRMNATMEPVLIPDDDGDVGSGFVNESRMRHVAPHATVRLRLSGLTRDLQGVVTTTAPLQTPEAREL